MKPYTPKMTEETFFLSSDKRSELIDKLVGYGMPLRLSICEAVIVDDLAVVNFRMAETARNCLSGHLGFPRWGSSAILTI